MITPTTTAADLTEDQIRADALRWAANRIDPGPASTRRKPFDLLDDHVMVANRGTAAQLRLMADQIERGYIAATVLPAEQRTAAPGTFAALHAQAEAEQDYPRVTLPSGLSGRVAMVRSTPGRYVIELLGFGVGDTRSGATVEAGDNVAATIDATLRSRPLFVAALRHRQAQDRERNRPGSPLSQGRDRWLADLDAAALPAEQRIA